MNEEQKTMLKQIVSSPPAFGAFSGMLFNAKLAHPEKSTEELLTIALQIKSDLLEMSK